MPPHKVREVRPVEVAVELLQFVGPTCDARCPIIVVYRGLLSMASERHRHSVPIVPARVLKEKQNVLLHAETIPGHRAKDGFEIVRVTSVGHQVQPAPSVLKKSTVLTTDAVSLAV
jgi:hypothetical protein